MEPKHTKLGIASFLLSLVAGFAAFGFFLLALFLDAVGHHQGPNKLGVFIFLVFLFGYFSANLAALGLGIAGMLQQGCKRVFAVVGTTIAGLQIAGTLLLILAMVVKG